jgi:hypothetical protein
MKSLVCAVKSNTGAELLNSIMNVSAHIRNDKLSGVSYVTFMKRHNVHNQGDNFK